MSKKLTEQIIDRIYYLANINNTGQAFVYNGSTYIDTEILDAAISGLEFLNGFPPHSDEMRIFRKNLYSDYADQRPLQNITKVDVEPKLDLNTVGSTGISGIDGKEGPRGYKGLRGKMGVPGYIGATGIQGNNNISSDTNPQLGSDLDVNGFSITSANNVDITIDPGGTGSIILKSGDVRFEDTGNVWTGGIKLIEGSLFGTNAIKITAPMSLASDITFTFPGAYGTQGQVLYQSDGTGTLNFMTPLSATNPIIKNMLTVGPVSPGIGSDPSIYLRNVSDTYGVILKVNDAISADQTFYIPSTDGTSGQAMITDGSGNLSFTTISSGTSSDWNGFTSIKVLPRDFMIATDDIIDYPIKLPGTSGSAGGYIQAHDAGPGIITDMVAFVPIPKNATAYDIEVFGSTTDTFSVHTGSVETSVVGADMLSGHNVANGSGGATSTVSVNNTGASLTSHRWLLNRLTPGFSSTVSSYIIIYVTCSKLANIYGARITLTI